MKNGLLVSRVIVVLKPCFSTRRSLPLDRSWGRRDVYWSSPGSKSCCVLIPEEGYEIVFTLCLRWMVSVALFVQNSPAIMTVKKPLNYGNVELRAVILACVFKPWRKCHHLYSLPVLGYWKFEEPDSGASLSIFLKHSSISVDQI